MQFMNKLILILDTLNREGNVGVVELSRKTDMPTTTVYRILTELTQHGLVKGSRNQEVFPGLETCRVECRCAGAGTGVLLPAGI